MHCQENVLEQHNAPHEEECFYESKLSFAKQIPLTNINKMYQAY